MDKPEAKPNEPRWYNRGIGVFCGGVLGIVASGLIALVWSDLSNMQVLVSLAFGLAAGLTTGYLFPRITESVLWILSIFG